VNDGKNEYEKANDVYLRPMHSPSPTTTEELVQTLNTFVPFPDDDLVNDTEQFLYALMEQWKLLPKKERAIPAIFQLIERYPQANFGSPGPLVHAVESLPGSYEELLHLSLLRKPTPLTLWMYNRIINAERDPAIWKAHLTRLTLFAQHPLADAGTKEVAEEFIRHQEARV
jgi:hypothetical protein